ncbi:MAG: bifunctional methylenetetrahydrofolate dehydrogenase/methenyltetrahydrofolate cyclohydrolase FolD [Candidatus Sumerlaeia bacterium]|nr:bifunctional methylenetetrahydrofolate dehydrogenase/methenyltetrahydrofolate cyclohydrolase FolD [Candidatus Sumerlaeia bacterium]
MTPAKIIDGKQIAATIREEIRLEVLARLSQGYRAPGLGVILVGSNPASESYVRSKTKACAEAGFHSVQRNLPESVSQAELIAEVQSFNNDPLIDGILVQLPLPKHIDESAVIDSILPEKDVDGFHPLNVGNLGLGRTTFVPCTPKGVQELLIRSNIETKGKFAVVLGRSNIVGKPMASLLVNKGPGGDCTVCVCHSATQGLAAITRQADILIAAIGRAHFVTAEMVKPGATVIDVGINRIVDSTMGKGSRLVGDVDYDAVSQIAGAITPVPGGVGPMTIAMLLKNTLESAYQKTK